MLSRYKKKQFLTMPAKKGRTKDTMFGKAFPFLADGDKYNDKTSYLKTQPRETRKKGFLSSDAHRVDEFSSTLRMNQYRWGLGRENAFNKMHLESNKKRDEANKKRCSTAPAGSQRGGATKSKELGQIEKHWRRHTSCTTLAKGNVSQRSIRNCHAKTGIRQIEMPMVHVIWVIGYRPLMRLGMRWSNSMTWRSQRMQRSRSFGVLSIEWGILKQTLAGHHSLVQHTETESTTEAHHSIFPPSLLQVYRFLLIFCLT